MSDAAISDPGSALPAGEGGRSRPNEALRAVRRTFDSIDQVRWDACAAATPWATPFARWAVHRAWWDAYGENAHDQTTVLVPAGSGDDADPVAIVPLMHRHAVEPDDAILRTQARASGATLTPVAPTAKAVYFGATYHADYATVLAAPDDLARVADAIVEQFAAPAPVDGTDPIPWDVIDLRRLREGDPAAHALGEAFGLRAARAGWLVTREREEVCPVVTLEPGGDFDGYLAALGKKERHEVRRKLRRAEAAGSVSLDEAGGTERDLEDFIDLHQKRWGADGLFPATPGGDQSRVFFRRLLELGIPPGFVRLWFLTVDGRRIAAGLTLEDAAASYFYNAGIDPAARDLSPGVLLSALVIREAIDAGRTRFDYLRGNEPYKYEWGAVDESVWRLLVVRAR